MKAGQIVKLLNEEKEMRMKRSAEIDEGFSFEIEWQSVSMYGRLYHGDQQEIQIWLNLPPIKESDPAKVSFLMSIYTYRFPDWCNIFGLFNVRKAGVSTSVNGLTI